MTVKEEDAFHRGMLAALSVVHSFDNSVLYEEIVRTAGEKDLVRVARKYGDMRFSGMSAYLRERKGTP